MGQRIHLNVTLFGGFLARMKDQSVLTQQTAGSKLISYLSLSRNMSATRAQLATLLWENSDEVSARRNLRQLLFRVRRELGQNWLGLISDSNIIRLDPSLVRTDVRKLLSELDQGKISTVLLETTSIHSDLLDPEKFEGTLSASWLHMVRRELENQLQQRLEPIMRGADPALAERAARALLLIDAADETAACTLMELYLRQGDLGRAMRVYANLWSHLDSEFGMEPGSITQELILRIKSEDSPLKTVSSTKPTNLKNTIYVEPAVVASMAKENAVKAELFRHEVITGLSNFRQFQIIDGTIQQESAQNILKLAFTSSSDSLRLVATLLETNTGVVLWSETFSNITDQWWQHQITIAGCLASACATSISASRVAEIEDQQTPQTALDNWLLGQTFMLEFRHSSDRRAKTCFQDCIKLAPKSSMGYSALSQLMNGQHLLGPSTQFSSERIRQSKQFANNAISLDPRDTRAHLSRAWASCLLKEFDQADASFSMARTLNTYDPWTVMSSALAAAFMGQQSLAAQLSEFFFLNRWIPTSSHWGYLTSVRFLAGEYEGAIESAENSVNAIHNVLGWQAAAQWHSGREEEAHQSWLQFEALLAQTSEPGTEFSRERILEWFLSAFPLRLERHQKALSDGVRGAIGQRH